MAKAHAPLTRAEAIRLALLGAAEHDYAGTIVVLMDPRPGHVELLSYVKRALALRLRGGDFVLRGFNAHDEVSDATPFEMAAAQTLFPTLAEALGRGDSVPVITLTKDGPLLTWEPTPELEPIVDVAVQVACTHCERRFEFKIRRRASDARAVCLDSCEPCKKMMYRTFARYLRHRRAQLESSGERALYRCTNILLPEMDEAVEAEIATGKQQTEEQWIEAIWAKILDLEAQMPTDQRERREAKRAKMKTVVSPAWGTPEHAAWRAEEDAVLADITNKCFPEPGRKPN